MRKIFLALCGGLLVIGVGGTPALAQKRSVAEEILDVLRANNQLSEQQYHDLLNRTRAESEQTESIGEIREQVAKLPQADDSTFRVYWNSGLRLESPDGDFKLRIGGRIQNDWVIYSTDEEIREDVNEGRSSGDGTEFRRARVNLQGEIYNNIGFRLELDFAGGEAAFKDAYLSLADIPYVGTYQVGHFKEPFSLEQLNSSNYLTFMERSLADTFAPARNTGMMLQNTVLNERATWAVGVFREVDDTGNGFGPDDDYNVTARLTALPWYVEKGQRFVHAGFGYSHKFRDDKVIRFRARPEAHLGPQFVDTGDFPTDGVDLIGPEFALVLGPASLQAEWMRAMVDGAGTEDADFTAWYVYGSYFLTGEYRPYRTSNGTFDRGKPLRNFDWNGGWGAWEVGARYSYLDLNEDDIRGGILGDITFGINWYLNPNVRIMLNYVYADKKGSGEANIVESRFQVDF